MATLEAHDDQGRVSFVELSRDHPVLFGSSKACDVVLNGAGVLPVHGRIRWKKGRYKVEASPDAEFVLVNGHRMASSSLHQGDEIAVGPCRLYLLRVDEDLGSPAGRRRPVPEAEPTQRLESTARPTASASSPQERIRTSGRQPRLREGPRETPLERADWLAALELDATPEPGAHEGLEDGGASLARAGTERDGTGSRLRRWAAAIRGASHEAPGEERILTSPVVLGLAASLLLLLVMGLWLRTIVVQTLATRTYSRAVELLDDGDYRTSIREFDAFLNANPDDSRAGKARVLRALANVRQYVTVSGTMWSSALQAAREMFERVGQEPEFRDQRVELAELIVRIGEGLADRARRTADARALEEAESAVALHAAVAGEPAAAFLARSRLPGLLAEARGAVLKAQIRGEALNAMDDALREGSARGVYQARDALLARYGDLAHDRELIERMTRANDLIRRGVQVRTVGRKASTSVRVEPLGPPTSLILRSMPTAPRPAAPSPSMVYALADGLAFGFNAATGEPRWQVPVGLASPFPPRPIPGDSTVLVVDARHHELLRLDAQTGRLVWRLELGEPVEAPPLILGDQLYQLLPGGQVLVIGLESGEAQAVVDLGMPLAASPATDESGRFVYVVGRKDCLFLLARDPLGCVAVEYLGHSEGSICSAPARVGRFLIVAENDRLAQGRIRVFVLDEEGAVARPVQEAEVAGWIWSTPAAAGSMIWATGDLGGIEAFALGDYGRRDPLRSVARYQPDQTVPSPAFAVARSERELWVASASSGRFELDPERGELTLRFPLGPWGPAVAAPQVAGPWVAFTSLDDETDGISVAGVEFSSGSVSWRTVVGASWPAPLLTTRDHAFLRTIGRTGHEVRITKGLLQSGGFVELPLPGPGGLLLPPGTLLEVGEGEQTATLVSASVDASEVWVRKNSSPSDWRRVELPATLAAMPLAWGSSLLIPGRDGRAYLVDPRTGLSTAEPLVPVFDRQRSRRWLDPASMDRESVLLAEDSGRLLRVRLRAEPTPRMDIENQTDLATRLAAPPACTGGAVIVVTADHRVRSLAARDLSPVGSWQLEGPPVDGPIVVDQLCFVFDLSGTAMALDREGRNLWTIHLYDPIVGHPVIRGGRVCLIDQKGRLHLRSVEDGRELDRRDLGILPAGGLLALEDSIVIPSGRGTLHSISLEPAPRLPTDPHPTEPPHP